MKQRRRFSVLTLAILTLFVFSAPPMDAGIIAYGAPEVQAQSGQPVRAYLAYFTTSRSTTKAEEIVVTIDWGDGTTTTGACVDDRSGRFWVYGDHSYPDSGVYKVKIRIYDTIMGFGTKDIRPGVM